MPSEDLMLSLKDIDQLQKLLIDPLISAQNIHHAQIEREIAGLRQDYRDGLRETRAILSTIQDPETGYVPRVHVNLMLDAVETRATELRTYVDGQFRSVREDMDREFAERDGNQRTSLATRLTAGGIIVSTILSALAIGVQFIRH